MSNVYAIADLHLDGGQDKPMSVFSDKWDNHKVKIENSWRECVSEDDLVLIPGDISWAMYLEDALNDLRWIDSLPGQKVILRGNHDYWWSTITKVREALPKSIRAIQNDAIVFDEFVLAGTRGWTVPMTESPLKPEDEKIYLREVGRMALSLKAAKQKGENLPVWVMMHYPPFNEKCEKNAFLDLFDAFGVQKVVYGHIHGLGIKNCFSGVLNGITYKLVSADGLGFKLYQL